MQNLSIVSTYDLSWQEAMGDLNEQIHIEDHTLDVEGDNEVPAPVGYIKNFVGFLKCFVATTGDDTGSFSALRLFVYKVLTDI